jgi:methylmalonyl-CoA mutase
MTPDFTRIPYGFDEFPRASPAQWQQQAGAIEPWPSPEGIAHRALYTAADAQGLPHLGSLPRIPPFPGGPYATMFAQKPWTIRQYAGLFANRPSRAYHPAHGRRSAGLVPALAGPPLRRVDAALGHVPAARRFV